MSGSLSPLYVMAYCDGLLDAIHDEFVVHPVLGQFMTLEFRSPPAALAEAFFRWNWVTREYVIATKQMLARSAELLSRTDPAWSARIHDYLEDETYVAGGERKGHEDWNTDDLERGGAADPSVREIVGRLATTPRPALVGDYVAYFVDRAAEHPYACLGAKRLLEGVTVSVGPPYLRGLRAAPSAPLTARSLSFVAKHIEADGGDSGHLAEGDEALATLDDPGRLGEVLDGLRAASRMYRRLLAWV